MHARNKKKKKGKVGERRRKERKPRRFFLELLIEATPKEIINRFFVQDFVHR